MNTIDDFKEFEIERLDLVLGGDAPIVQPGGYTQSVTCTPSGNRTTDTEWEFE